MDEEYCGRSVDSAAKQQIFVMRLRKYLKISYWNVSIISLKTCVENDSPLDNIARHLFLGVVRLYNADNVSRLQFDDENYSNMLFWIYGQWLFVFCFDNYNPHQNPCHKTEKSRSEEHAPLYPPSQCC